MPSPDDRQRELPSIERTIGQSSLADPDGFAAFEQVVNINVGWEALGIAAGFKNSDRRVDELRLYTFAFRFLPQGSRSGGLQSWITFSSLKPSDELAVDPGIESQTVLRKASPRSQESQVPCDQRKSVHLTKIQLTVHFGHKGPRTLRSHLKRSDTKFKTIRLLLASCAAKWLSLRKAPCALSQFRLADFLHSLSCCLNISRL